MDGFMAFATLLQGLAKFFFLMLQKDEREDRDSALLPGKNRVTYKKEQNEIHLPSLAQQSWLNLM